jgi:hypothetical protein
MEVQTKETCRQLSSWFVVHRHPSIVWAGESGAPPPPAVRETLFGPVDKVRASPDDTRKKKTRMLLLLTVNNMIRRWYLSNFPSFGPHHQPDVWRHFSNYFSWNFNQMSSIVLLISPQNGKKRGR